jgi:hypothetical protein
LIKHIDKTQLLKNYYALLRPGFHGRFLRRNAKKFAGIELGMRSKDKLGVARRKRNQEWRSLRQCVEVSSTHCESE